MAVIAKEVPQYQAGFYPPRELHRPVGIQRTSLAERFHPDNPPRLREIGKVLDVSEEADANERLFAYTDHVALSRAARAGQNVSVFPGRNIDAVIDTFFVEVGQIDYWDPNDKQFHEGPYIHGEQHDLGVLSAERERLVRKGKIPTNPRHQHPSDEPPILSTDDLLVFLMQRRDGLKLPLIGAATVLGKKNGQKFQVKSVRTRDSHVVLPSWKVKEKGEKWNLQLDFAAETAQAEWEAKYGVLSPNASYEEAASFDAHVDAATDAVLAGFVTELRIPMYLSTDLREGELLPPDVLISRLRSVYTEELQAVA